MNRNLNIRFVGANYTTTRKIRKKSYCHLYLTGFLFINLVSEGTRTQKEDLTAKVIGDFGRWQLKIGILMTLLKFPMAWYQLNIIFMAPPQDFWCKKPAVFASYSDEEWRQICSPVSKLNYFVDLDIVSNLCIFISRDRQYFLLDT